MTTLRLIVEGQTEARFATRTLAPHLGSFGVFASASAVVTRGKRGGVREGQGGGDRYTAWKRDITHWIRQEEHKKDFWFSTMFDLYGLARVDGFPGFLEASKVSDPLARVTRLEESLREDINFPRFIPYIQLHEFETLLLADPAALCVWFIGQDAAVGRLAQEISESGLPPEFINDGEQTKPSSRIQKHLSYVGSKVTAGPDVAEKIGLQRLMSDCPHFGQWVRRLEQLGTKSSP